MKVNGKRVLVILMLILALAPACALAKTNVKDMYELCEALMPGDDGKVSDSIVFSNDILWQEVDYCYDDERESDGVFVFRHDVVVDMNGHELKLVVGTTELISIFGDANATIRNGSIVYGSQSEYDPEDGETYTTEGFISGEFVKFSDAGGRTRGTLTLDNVCMSIDIYPPEKNRGESDNIVQMNGGDTLNIVGGSDIFFADRKEGRYTSTLVSAQGSGNTLKLKDSHLTGSLLKDGIVGNCVFKSENAKLSLYVDGYFIRGNGMKLTMDASEFTGYGDKGMAFADSSLTMKNHSWIWQDDGSLPLTIENKNVSFNLGATSWMELDDQISVPAGTTFKDYLNTKDGVDYETRRITMVGKRYTVRFTDGLKDEERFADQVDSLIYMDSVPYKYEDWKGHEGFLGFAPDADTRVEGNMTFTAIWEPAEKDEPIVLKQQEPTGVGEVSVPITVTAEVFAAALDHKCDIVIRKDDLEITVEYEFMKAVGIDGSVPLELPAPPKSEPIEAICNNVQLEAVKGLKIEKSFSIEWDAIPSDFNGATLVYPIQFTLPEGMRAEQFVLLCIKEDGSLEPMAITWKGNQAYGVFTHFSDYVVVQVDEKVDIPRTGDNSHLFLWMGLLAASLCAYAVGRKIRA